MILALVVAACAPPLSAAPRRSSTVRTAFKYSSPCPATGRSTGPCPGWIIDHVIPLACGGDDASDNMQWQTVDEAKAKDRWERRGCTPSSVCCNGVVTIWTPEGECKMGYRA